LLRQDIEDGAELERRRLKQELERIDSAAGQLSAMISELSDIARLQMGRALVLQRRITDLVVLAQTVADQHKQRSKRHRIRVDAALPQIVGNWDNVRLQRALSNLIDNAIKYSPLGGDVTIVLDTDSPDGSAFAKATVTDQGIGIPEVDLPHVFDRFYRAGNVASHIAGSGIGLSGVKQVIEQHGGLVEVKSDEGSGTSVTILLPLSVEAE
jgi:signal transduction histidine kinase